MPVLTLAAAWAFDAMAIADAVAPKRSRRAGCSMPVRNRSATPWSPNWSPARGDRSRG
jgi:hypothetical protein